MMRVLRPQADARAAPAASKHIDARGGLLTHAASHFNPVVSAPHVCVWSRPRTIVARRLRKLMRRLRANRNYSRCDRVSSRHRSVCVAWREWRVCHIICARWWHTHTHTHMRRAYIAYKRFCGLDSAPPLTQQRQTFAQTGRICYARSRDISNVVK